MSNDLNPWKTLSSRITYQNPWITVREDQVIRPDGKPGIYGVVDCRIAVAIVGITNDNRVVLVGQYRYPTKEYSWEVVEGGSEAGEDPLETAKRELKEEAGYVAKEWKKLGKEIHLSNCHSSEIGVVYLATDLTRGESNPEGTEVLEVKLATLEECQKMIETGEMKDALSIIAVNRAIACL